MRPRFAVALAMGFALALIGQPQPSADPLLPRAPGGEAKCVADNFTPAATTSDAPLCRRGGKSERNSAGASRVQLPEAWPMAAASAWEAFPAPGLSGAVRPQSPFAHGFANTGAGSTAAGAKLDDGPLVLQARPSELTPKLSFTGDVGIPNNHTLDDVLRQQYRGPAAMDTDSMAGKLVNTIGALKLGIKVDY
jgi:hypothetical protein